MATAPSWTAFLVTAIPFGLGLGAIDGGMNGLILDLYPASRGRALNLLHLCFSLGALASPLVVGRLVEAGSAWQTVVAARARRRDPARRAAGGRGPAVRSSRGARGSAGATPRGRGWLCR